METHGPTLELHAGLPAEIAAGQEAALQVGVSCAHGCDLRGTLVEVAAPDGHIDTYRLEGTESADDRPHGVSARIPIVTPAETGDAIWQIRVREREAAGISHSEVTLAVISAVVPHECTMAVFDVPSPIEGSRFTVRVGIKCSSCCALGGQVVAILDESGRTVGEGVLDASPLQGTSALYAATVSLSAPEEAGVRSCRAVFVPKNLALPHGEASNRFTYRCLEPPEHTVTVKLVPGGVGAPLTGIEVCLGSYRGTTDAAGIARIGVPGGTFDLHAWRVDLEPVSRRIDVKTDATVEVPVGPRLIADEDADRAWA